MTNDTKTTVTGLVGAIAVAVWPVIQTGHISWAAVGGAVLVGLHGYFTNKPDKPAAA
jgi:hypothetical protein